MQISDSGDAHAGTEGRLEAQDAAEAEAPSIPWPLPPEAPETAQGRPRSLLALMLAATVISGLTAFALIPAKRSFLTCSAQRFSGAHIEQARTLVLVAALVAFVLTIVTRNGGLHLMASLSVMSVALIGGIVLVALDSATWRGLEICDNLFGGSDATPTVAHVDYAYAIWGTSIIVLLWQASRLLRAHRSAEPEAHR